MFHKTKYGDELLIDVVSLKDIKKYLRDSLVHTLTYYDITLITEGAGKFQIDDNIYGIKPTDVIFSVEGQVRKWDVNTVQDGLALIFDEEFILSFFSDKDFLNNLSYFHCSVKTSFLKLSADEYKNILSLLQNIKSEITYYEVKNKHILRSLLYQVLSLLDRIYLEQNSCQEKDCKAPSRYVKGFVELVGKDFKKQHTITYYACQLCITSNYLNDLVKQSLGISAKQFIQDKLILEAKKMLLYTSFTISEIALELNYESASYFSRVFKVSVGTTPLGYRNKQTS